jgi:hypothetical protein
MTQQDRRSRQIAAARENQTADAWHDDDWLRYGKPAPPPFTSRGAGRRASGGHVGALAVAAVAVFAATVAAAVLLNGGGPADGPPAAAFYPGGLSDPLFPRGTSGGRTLFMAGTVSAVSGTSVTIAVHGRVLAAGTACPATFTAVITGYRTRPSSRVLRPGPRPDPVSRTVLGQGSELWMRVLVIKDGEVTVTAIVTGHRQATDLRVAPRIRSGR